MTVGAGLCSHCSRQQQQAVPESVSHMLLDCSRYTSLRQRLIAQLRRIPIQQQPDRPPPAIALPLTLSAILDAPPSGLIARSASA